MKHIIYKITNKVNGKIYIGAHSTKNLKDNYYGSGKLILRALKKYSIENFDKEILHTFNTKEEMFEKEKEIITQNFVNRKDTYNVIIGGDVPPIYEHTEESRQRVSKQFKGVMLSEDHKQKISNTKKKGYHPYRGKELPEEHKEKNRQAQIGRKHTKETKHKMSENMKGENNPNFGKKLSKETREKMSKARRGGKRSKETKAKMRAARKKYYGNPENRKKQSERMKGNTNSKKSRGD